MSRGGWIHLAVAALLLIGAPPTARASQDQAPLSNDEVVLAQLDPTGLPIQAQLLSRISSGGGQRSVEDPSSTTNVRYRDRRGSPPTTPTGVLLDVGGPLGDQVLTEAVFDKPLPVALHAEYALDGRSVNPAEVLGAAGAVTVTYTVTNTTAESQAITYTDAAGVQRGQQLPVFVPFTGSLVVTVPQGMSLLSAPGAAQSTDGQGRTVLAYNLLLAPPTGDFQQVFSVRMAADRGATPGASLLVAPATSDQNPALGFASSLVGQSAASSAQLADGVAALDAGAGSVADGAAALAEGASQLAQGQAALASALDDGADGAAAAASGAEQLAAGLDRLAAGLAALSGPAGLPAAASGAQVLADAAAGLADLVGSSADGAWAPQIKWPAQGLPPGLPGWPPTPADLPQWADALAGLQQVLAGLGFAPDGRPRDGICDLDVDGDGRLDDPIVDIDCVPTLVQSLRALAAAAGAAGTAAAQLPPLLAGVGTDLKSAAAGTAAAADQALAAAAGASDLYEQLCADPAALPADQCAGLAAVAAAASAAAADAQDAGGKIGGTAPALSQAAVRAAGLAAGLPVLAGLLSATAEAAALVGDGLRGPTSDAPGLVGGLNLLRDGLQAAQRAAEGLAGGAAAAAGSAQQLSAGSGAIAEGAGRAAVGAEGLLAGSRGVGSGATALSEGARALQTQGTGPALRSIIDGSADAALAAAYLAAVDLRAADALPYGPPEGAIGHAAYAFEMPETSQSTGIPGWLLAVLVGWGAAGVAGALRARSRR